jgi:thymidylate synthase ThyX
MEPKVTLLSWTQQPLETVYSVWRASKTEKTLLSPMEVSTIISKSEIEDTFRAIIAQRIPIGEHINFVFMLEGVSVSWREQAVRHRIGTHPSPERLGADMTVDIMPNLHNSSWWSQSMRIQNMGRFYDDEMFRVPDTLKGKVVPREALNNGYDATLLYYQTMSRIQDAYNSLVAAGVPLEDARELIPLGAQHRISWSLNMNSLQHILGERGCWILQLGIWGPIIKGMVRELATKIHPIFYEMISPPCMDGDEFNGCVYKEECKRRMNSEDNLPPCPLYVNYHYYPLFSNIEFPMVEEMKIRAEQYRNFWGRNPYTGKRNAI